MKVSELEGAELDYWVARSNGWTFGPPHRIHGWDVWRDSAGEIVGTIPAHGYEPSSNWSNGGPIIERERPAIEPCWGDKGWYVRSKHAPCDGDQFYGDTLLIAAMRAYVASKFGDEVDSPQTYQQEK